MSAAQLIARAWGWVRGKWKAFWTTFGKELVGTGIGALIGAMLAFYSERHFRDNEVEDKNLEAGLLVLATLEDMERTLFANYCVNVMPYRTSKRPWLDLGANPTDFPSAQPLDTPSMSFLLPRAGLSIYERLNGARDAYTSYAEMMSRRNRLLWEVIYPATDSLQKEQSRPGFESRVAAAIGTSSMQQAHQAALAMLETRRFIQAIDDAESLIHLAMRREFGDKVPQMPEQLWPADRKIPDCSSVESDGTFGRVRPIPTTLQSDDEK